MEFFERMRNGIRDMELKCLEEVQREGEDRERERLKIVNEATKYSDILSQKEILVLGAEFELMDKNWDQTLSNPSSLLDYMKKSLEIDRDSKSFLSRLSGDQGFKKMISPPQRSLSSLFTNRFDLKREADRFFKLVLAEVRSLQSKVA